MELYDETSGSSNGLIFYDVNRKLRYMKIFNEEWRCSDSQWFLRAGDGGLLVYSCKRNGNLQVINPLTMQSHYLEDVRLNRRGKLSYYMKKHHDDVAVQLNFDSKEKTYQVTVIIGYRNILRSMKFIILIYKSAEERWEIRDAPFERRLCENLTHSFLPSIFMRNQKIYWICRDAKYVLVCDLNGDGNIRYLWIPLARQRLLRGSLGVVMYKGRMIMVCKVDPRQHPAYTNALIFYEFDEHDGDWRSKYEVVVSPINLFPGVICVGGDYIWVIKESQGYVSHIICIDIDSGELKIWPLSFMFNARKCLSMPLSFCPSRAP